MVSCQYPCSRESVHIKLLVSSVLKHFTEYFTSTHGLSSLCKVCLPCNLPFPRLSPYRPTDRQTNRVVDYSNSHCACTRGLTTKFLEFCMCFEDSSHYHLCMHCRTWRHGNEGPELLTAFLRQWEMQLRWRVYLLS